MPRTPPDMHARRLSAPLATSAAEANPLRRRVESCLLQRERTVSQLIGWLRTIYRVQENVGAMYGSQVGEFRRWNKLSETTQKDHRIQCAVYLAALRMHTLQLVEALEEWRHSRPTLQVITGSGATVTVPRPFVWRGRWWPLQLMLDPPLLPLPLPVDPLMLRWFAEEAELWKGEKATTSPKPSPSNGSLPRASSAPTLGPLGVPEVDATPPRALLRPDVAPSRDGRAHVCRRREADE